MQNKAIIIFSDISENDEAIPEWCTNEIASIPIYKRAIFSANKAGIDEFIFFGCDEKEKIEHSIRQDNRINADIKWYDKKTRERLNEVIANETEDNPDKCLFIIKANALFDYRILNRLSNISLDGAVASAVSLKPNNNSTNKISDVKGVASNGIIFTSHKIKDYVTPAHAGFSLQGLTERLKKEDLLKTVEINDCLYEEINSQASFLSSEKKLFQSLGSSSDSPIIDKLIIRKISGAISKISLRTSITPNQVTIASLILGILSGFFFYFGGYKYNIPAGLLYFLSVILDQCDGEVARLKYMESEFGGILDIICDTIVNTAIVAGITCATYREVGSGFIIILGILAAVGISISLLLTTYFDVHKKDQLPDKSREWLDKLNNKDFFYVIIFGCIAVNQMIWFLLVMAVGPNIYWITHKIVHRANRV